MTRTDTGRFSFGASIILFLGALLLAPQTAPAQESPECKGEQQTIITATGLKITTCNWDLEDAPIDKAAAGLETTLLVPDSSSCRACKYDKIKTSRWDRKFPNNRECFFDANRTMAVNGTGLTNKGAPTVASFVSSPSFQRCAITFGKRSMIATGLSQEQANACANDLVGYEVANNIGQGNGRFEEYCLDDTRCTDPNCP